MLHITIPFLAKNASTENRESTVRGPSSSVPFRVRLRRRYFTLAEVVIAAGILALASVGVFGSIIMAQFLFENAREHLEGEGIAMDAAWEYFNKDYETLLAQENVVTQSVPENSLLYPLGGTLRVAVLQYSEHCEIQARVDWSGRTITHRPAPSHEQLTVLRYQTDH